MIEKQRDRYKESWIGIGDIIERPIRKGEGGVLCTGFVDWSGGQGMGR